MALRNQPYLPLYVKDFRNDEKLARCSAASHGVYILLLCILHSERDYGKLLLRQSERQSTDNIQNFAAVLARMMPFSLTEVCDALSELFELGVISIDGDCLYQKRMVRDNEISEIRANAGKKGSSITNGRFSFDASKDASKNTAKEQQNHVYENDTVIEDDSKLDTTEKEIDECIIYLNSVINGGFKPKTESNRKFIRARIKEGYTIDDFKRVIDNQWLKWKDTDMAEYMRPETLFNATKFQSYINAPDYSKVKPKPTGEPKGGVTRITPDFFTKLAKEHKENDT